MSINELRTIYANMIAIQFYEDLTPRTDCEYSLDKTVQRRKKVPRESRKKRAHPVGQDKRWNPAEITVTKKGSPADQKAWRNKCKRVWREAFVEEEIDVYAENKPAKVRTPVYDKPCQSPHANYCNSKWPDCPGIKRVYVTPKWPVYN